MRPGTTCQLRDKRVAGWLRRVNGIHVCMHTIVSTAQCGIRRTQHALLQLEQWYTTLRMNTETIGQSRQEISPP